MVIIIKYHYYYNYTNTRMLINNRPILQRFEMLCRPICYEDC